MTMTNAQAALIAAANSAVRGSAVPVEPVLKRAASYLLWLDEQAETKVSLVTVNKPVEDNYDASIRALYKEPVVQCDAVSANYTRCMLAKGHTLEHRNSQEGEYWSTKPVVYPVTHFYTGSESGYASCGSFMFNETPVSMSLDSVTCGGCRESLGL